MSPLLLLGGGALDGLLELGKLLLAGLDGGLFLLDSLLDLLGLAVSHDGLGLDGLDGNGVRLELLQLLDGILHAINLAVAVSLGLSALKLVHGLAVIQLLNLAEAVAIDQLVFITEVFVSHPY